MFIIMLIILLFSSTESKLAALSSINNGKTNKHTSKTLSARLIHRSSPELPFYNPNYTRSDHIRNAVRASIARSYYYSRRKGYSPGDYVAAPIHGYPGSGFLMNFTMGTPPVHRYGLLDTGSSLTWFQCLPCINCYGQGDYPLYDPTKSTSYEQALCDTEQCDLVPENYCKKINSTEICHYHIGYTDGTKSRGIVSMDSLSLSFDNITKTLEEMVFGCANDSIERFENPGIVGLSNHPASLHEQLGFSHFSYFVFANKTNIEGEVHFGPGASLSDTGANTPIIIGADEFYYLNMIGISVDGSDLDLPSDYFEVVGGVKIDSGAEYTILPRPAFEELKNAIADQMYMYTQVKGTYDYFELCYRNYTGGAPEVVFQFSGLDFALCDSNLWEKDSESNSCLAIMSGHKTVIGMYQQRNVQVGFDLVNNLLTLNPPEDCPDPDDVIDFMQ